MRHGADTEQTGSDMDDIYCSIFTERDLFGLDVKVDTLFKNEERFRQDGIMKVCGKAVIYLTS